jgi:hypothetical protein
MVKRLDSRLAQVEAKEQVRLAERVGGPAMLLVYPDAWPPDDLAAFDGDDPHVRAEVMERQAGKRPGPRTRILAIRVDRAGPA